MLRDNGVALFVNQLRPRHPVHVSGSGRWEERGTQHYRHFETLVIFAPTMVVVFMNDLVGYRSEASNLDIARSEVNRIACSIVIRATACNLLDSMWRRLYSVIAMCRKDAPPSK